MACLSFIFANVGLLNSKKQQYPFISYQYLVKVSSIDFSGPQSIILPLAFFNLISTFVQTTLSIDYV